MPQQDPENPLPTKGAMGERIARRDWDATPLGPIDRWPRALLCHLSLVLETQFPAAIGWGPDLLTLHNDAYLPMIPEGIDALGLPFLDLWPEARPTLEPQVESALAGEARYHADTRFHLHRHEGAETAYFSYCLSPLRDDRGAVAGVLNIAIETTGQVQRAEALRQSEAKYRTLFEQIDEGFVVLDVLFNDAGRAVDLLIREANPAQRKHTGVDVVGKYVSAVVQRIEPSLLDRLGRVMRTGEATRFEHRVAALDRWFDAYAFPIDDAGERRVAVLFTDITARKDAEAARLRSEQHLRELSRTLEHRVAERARELHDQAARLRQVTAELTTAEHRERKRLATILHDDLQQLLVAAKMRLAAAQRRADDAAGMTAAITTATQLIEQAIRGSRDLTRELRPPVLHEHGFLAALRWLVQEMEERHGLRVSLEELQAEPDLADDVRALIYEAVRELLFNVVKHAGVASARVQVWQEPRLLHVLVEDQGAGFDPQTTASDRGQTGMGLLSMTERLAALGGAAHVESEPKRGTRVILTAPLAGAPREPDDAALPPVRVLVVDDHAVVRQGLAQLLGGDPRVMLVGEAGDGTQALEVIEQQRPDVVIMDARMPGMDGVEATRVIRRRWPEIKVVALLVEDDPSLVASMRDAGALEHVGKSTGMQQILEMVVRLGPGHQAR